MHPREDVLNQRVHYIQTGEVTIQPLLCRKTVTYLKVLREEGRTKNGR